MGLVCRRSVLAKSSFAWDSGEGSFKAWPCHSGFRPGTRAWVCECVLYIYMLQCVTCLVDREKYRKQKRTGKKYISNAILSDDAPVHLDEKPLFHNYAIFQFLPLHLRSPSPSQVFLGTRTILSHPWFKVSMLQ